MSRLFLAFGLCVAFSPSNANADLIFTFSPVSGGTQTRLTLTVPETTIAIGNGPGISDNTLSFNFLTVNVVNFSFPHPENFFVEGSVSGRHTPWRVLIDDDTPGTDDLQFDFNHTFTAGETLTGGGTDVADLAFSEILSGGMASNPIGAQFEIVLGEAVPEPSAFATISYIGLLSFGFRRWRRKTIT